MALERAPGAAGLQGGTDTRDRSRSRSRTRTARRSCRAPSRERARGRRRGSRAPRRDRRHRASTASRRRRCRKMHPIQPCCVPLKPMHPCVRFAASQSLSGSAVAISSHKHSRSHSTRTYPQAHLTGADKTGLAGSKFVETIDLPQCSIDCSVPRSHLSYGSTLTRRGASFDAGRARDPPQPARRELEAPAGFLARFHERGRIAADVDRSHR